jgi:hypothetical protein
MMLIPAPPLPVGWLGKPNASHLDRLIIFPRQEMSVLLEKAGLMVTFVDLFAGLRCSTTMLNGQIVLISLAPVAGHDFSAFLEGKGGNGRIFAAVKNKRRTRTIGIGKFRIITTI